MRNVGNIWVRWSLLAVFVVTLSITFLNLGQWQLNRLEQRRGDNEIVIAHESTAVQPYRAVMNKVISDDDQWQRVEVSGTFDPEHQLLVRYRSNAGAVGWELVTPLVTDSGDTVLVNRGFVPRAPGQDFPTVFPAPPSGPVTVVGHVRRDEQGKDNATVPNEVQTVRLINSGDIGAWLGRPVVNGYVGLLSVTPAQGSEFVPVEPPELSDGPHFWYAVQWFCFTLIAGAGLVVFIRNDIREKRRLEAKAKAAASA